MESDTKFETSTVEAAPNQTNTQSEEQTIVKTKLPFSVIGYILPFLFFLPLLDEKTKHNPAIRFHANQQLIILIVIGAVYLLRSMILAVLLTFGYFIIQLLSVAVLVLMAIGAYNAYQGKMEEVPFIGQFRILK
ncbi:MAG: hypothetical protein RL097_100 [Candidatus Parcubacteria bacterium]|jgi:uncharacterized membrane protein